MVPITPPDDPLSPTPARRRLAAAGARAGSRPGRCSPSSATPGPVSAWPSCRRRGGGPRGGRPTRGRAAARRALPRRAAADPELELVPRGAPAVPLGRSAGPSGHGGRPPGRRRRRAPPGGRRQAARGRLPALPGRRRSAPPLERGLGDRALSRSPRRRRQRCRTLPNSSADDRWEPPGRVRVGDRSRTDGITSARYDTGCAAPCAVRPRSSPGRRRSSA